MVNWLEWLGYLASLIILVSLLMSSIKKLRWINLIGALLFALYGFLIGSLPVAFMNLGIAIINIYYLYQMYRTQDYFTILPIEGTSQFLKYFLDFYHDSIRNYADESLYALDNFDLSFIILRNMKPAGVFLCTEYNDDTLKVELDFVIPEYRDFKIGDYIYHKRHDYFKSNGYVNFIYYSPNREHSNYLKRMGYEEVKSDEGSYFRKTIDTQ